MQSSTYEAIEQAAKEGADVMSDILKARETDKNQLALARIGYAAVMAHAKIYQASASREATVVRIISRVAPDGGEFRRLVQAALPGAPIAAALQKPDEAE